MATGNYVNVRVRALDDAKPDLAELRASLDELKGKVAEARATVDTKEGEARVLALDAQLEALSKKVASPRIDVAGAARALAQVAAVDLALDDVKAKADREGDKGLLARFFGGSGGSGGGGGGSFLSDIPLLGNPLVLAPVAAGVGAIATEATALVTGLSAAGLGAGSFAALAMPAVSKVSGAMKQLSADQDAYHRALTATAKANALKHIQQDLAGLSPAERGVVDGIGQVKDAFGKMSKAFEPTVFKVFNEGLKIANQLLPYVGKFAAAAAPAIEGLLNSLSKGLSSPAFKHFMNFLQSLSGPVIKAVGSGMTGLAGDVMQLMTVMSKKDVINGINIAFRLIGFALTTLIGIVKFSMKWWDGMTNALRQIAGTFDVVRHATAGFAHDWAHYFDVARHTVASVAHDVARYFDDVRRAFATAGHDIAHTFDTVRHDAASFVDHVVTLFEQLPGRILHALGNLGSLLLDSGKKIVQGLINGVTSMVGSVEHAIGGIVSDIKSFLPFSPAKKGPLSGAGAPENSGRSIARLLASGITSGAGDVSGAMRRLAGAATGPGVAGAGVAGAAGPAGGQQVVRLEFAGGSDDLLVRWLRQVIRTEGGGNVQSYLGRA